MNLLFVMIIFIIVEVLSFIVVIYNQNKLKACKTRLEKIENELVNAAKKLADKNKKINYLVEQNNQLLKDEKELENFIHIVLNQNEMLEENYKNLLSQLDDEERGEYLKDTKSNEQKFH